MRTRRALAALVVSRTAQLPESTHFDIIWFKTFGSACISQMALCRLVSTEMNKKTIRTYTDYRSKGCILCSGRCKVQQKSSRTLGRLGWSCFRACPEPAAVSSSASPIQFSLFQQFRETICFATLHH